jgi:electron transfer flavoprotein-quinone oxidoreductase
MSESEELDVVVVGAGVAGLACAFELAGAGLAVAVCERGDVAGAKNLSGGRLYLEPLRELCGALLDGAPFEREVVSESVVLSSGGAATTLRLDHPAGERPRSVTVLRAKLDRFLADRVGERGAFVMGEQRVDGLHRVDGRVAGVVVGGEPLPARAVVAADGVLSFLAQEAGLRPGRSPEHFGVGVKELVRLDRAVLEERFNVAPGQGAARMYLGDATAGLPGGGFLYTNDDSVSLGLVLRMDALARLGGEVRLPELVEAFKNDPAVAPLIAGGETLEYGAHLIPEGGHGARIDPGIPGMLVAGDAAGLVLNTGNLLRGMDLAMASGVLAARSIVAHREQPGSAACLAHYRAALDGGFVMRELRAHRKAPGILANERLYGVWPREVVAMMRSLFTVDAAGSAVSPKQAFRELRKNVGTWTALRDAWRILDL